MTSPLIAELTRRISSRALPDGGFAGLPGEPFRSEATAWAALALTAAGSAPELARRARQRLMGEQQPDGRLSTSPLHPGTAWPTAVALLAFRNDGEEGPARQRAAAFLTATRGDTFARPLGSPLGNDTELAGWPWVARTFSWVEPTALALLALAACGQGLGPRSVEGRRLLLDRQLAAGGWNYGNSAVFGRQLLPAPESTGPALAALAGWVEAPAVAPSLAYLEGELPRLRTPLSLGWALLALAAWRRPPAGAAAALAETLTRPSALADFDTVELALLLLAAAAPRGLPDRLREPTEERS